MYHEIQSGDREDYHLPVWRTGRRTLRFHAVSVPEICDALPGSSRVIDRHWNRRISSYGNDLRHRPSVNQDLTPEEIQKSGFDTYYVDHTLGLWPVAAGGIPHNACEYQSKGDAITDLFENMAAEQKARTTYDNILRLVKDPEVCDPIRFLREREIVHFQRFGEGLRLVDRPVEFQELLCV